MIRVGDRVRHVDIIGATGRVVGIEVNRAWVLWSGYSVPTWTEMARLVPLQTR